MMNGRVIFGGYVDDTVRPELTLTIRAGLRLGAVLP